MADISFGVESPFGAMLAETVDDLINVKASVKRLKEKADQITGGGVTKSALEGNYAFLAGVDDGDDLYDWIASLKANLDVITDAILAQVDRGG